MIDKKNLKIQDKDILIKIAGIVDKINLTILKDIPNITCFLSPLELSIVLELCEKENIKYELFGGYTNATRNKVLFYSHKQDFNPNINILKIDYNKKFSNNLTHSDYLGSILGLGITRDLVGDIIIGKYVYIFVDTNISDYILANYVYVGRIKVKVELTRDIQIIETERKIINLSFSSLRIDTVISSVFNISRSLSKELIEKERVFKNYMVVVDGNRIIKNGDVISVRSYGKFQFVEETGISKKGKIRGDIYLYS